MFQWYINTDHDKMTYNICVINTKKIWTILKNFGDYYCHIFILPFSDKWTVLIKLSLKYEIIKYQMKKYRFMKHKMRKIFYSGIKY